MGTGGEFYPLTQTVGLEFGEDFLADHKTGDATDVEELGLLLGTLCRSSEKCGDALEVGSLQCLLAWEPGRALRLKRSSGGFMYQAWKGVTGWEDFDDVPWEQVLTTDYLLDVTRPEALDRLCELPGLAWTGIRDFESSQWDECACNTDITSDSLAQATRLVLQLDVLLKGHDCPRGRLRLDFEKTSLWAWANCRDDYLMAMTERELPLSSRGALLRIGEAFILF